MAGWRTRSSSSFFHDLSTREIYGQKVSRSAFKICDFSSDLGGGGGGSGVLYVEHDGSLTPPLSLSFCKTPDKSHLLAVSDEDGFVSLYDTRRNLPSASCRERTEKARVSKWVAHNNAIFDLCWIKGGSQILTASGDQTVNIWNAETTKNVGVLVGHTGSVKSLCYHPSNPDLLVSGSRDGSFAVWDLRCGSNLESSKSLNTNQLSPVALVGHAHDTAPPKRTRRGKIAPVSITSVLFLKDDVSIATAGAADSVVKLWDTRKLKSPLFQTKPQGEQRDKEPRKHGISCLSQDKSGTYIVSSCMDNKIYLYNTLKLNAGPEKVFSGSIIESFFVKSAINPEGTHILGGSSDGNAYIWRVDKPDQAAVPLKGHEGEVTAVDWCESDVGKIATAADDFTVRVWNITKKTDASTLSPTITVRKRITAPNLQARRLEFNSCNDEPATSSSQKDKNPFTTRIPENEPSSPGRGKSPDLRTPESARKRPFLSFESEAGSPSSVLSPPPSLKRKTIRDYFTSATKIEAPSSP